VRRLKHVGYIISGKFSNVLTRRNQCD